MPQNVDCRDRCGGVPGPFIIHHFAQDTWMEVGKSDPDRPGNDPNEWKRTVLKTDRGQLYINPVRHTHESRISKSASTHEYRQR